MDNKLDDLWQGGPWEQPTPTFSPPPPVNIPPHAMMRQRPVLRPRRRRRWPALVGIASLIVVFCLSAVVLKTLFEAGKLELSELLPQDWIEQQYSNAPPAIPQADTGTGVTVQLLAQTGEVLSYQQIYEKNMACIVSIEAEGKSSYSSGTGVILTEDGYIITNAHVIAGASAVRVIFSDNSSRPASLVGFDAREDLAVLKVRAQGLQAAEFGNSDTLRSGDAVAAIGDPLGYRSTITDGIVSALDREVEVDGITMILIQTSAAINFGNSGGALINHSGQVVGITTIKIITEDGSAEALGFAIPSTRVKYVVDQLIDGKQIRTGAFGFVVYTLPSEVGGLEIIEVDPRSDAHRQGIRAGDILISANGQPVKISQDLSRMKQGLGPGDVVELTLTRDGKEFAVSVTLMDAAELD